MLEVLDRMMESPCSIIGILSIELIILNIWHVINLGLVIWCHYQSHSRWATVKSFWKTSGLNLLAVGVGVCPCNTFWFAGL